MASLFSIAASIHTAQWFQSFITDLGNRFYATFINHSNYRLFLEGLQNTVLIAILAIILGSMIGILAAVAKVYTFQTGRLKILDKLSSVYIGFFRGTPIVVQLMIFYYILFTNFDSAFVIAVIAFGLNSGAYVAEIVRAGILAIDPGQTEAGRSLGLNASTTMRKIILPQAIKNILPALGNEFIALLKETSVAGFITVVDLTRAGDMVRSQTVDPYFSLFTIAGVYLVLVLVISAILKRVERRLRKSDRR